MRKKQDLRIMKTKASLYRGFMSLLKAKPFEDISISNICSASLINRSTYYDHFNDKYELLQSMLTDMHEDFLKSLEVEAKDVSSTFYEILHSFLNFMKENLEVYSSLAHIDNYSIAKELISSVLIRSCDHFIQPIYEENIPYENYVLFYASGFSSLIVESLRSNSFSKEDLLLQMKPFLSK